jgi:hypothetical protein
MGAWMGGKEMGIRLGKMEGLGWRRQEAGDTVKHVEIEAIEPLFFCSGFGHGRGLWRRKSR